MRAIFIFVGVGLIKITYLNTILGTLGMEGFTYDINLVMTAFGGFLIYAGIKSAIDANSDGEEEEEDFSQSAGARFIKFLTGGKVATEYDGDKFFTIKNGIKYATPLLVVIGVIEFTDLLFAVDSIPAIFAIAPDDPFILYTSNIFAILGLRALYFLLANFIHMFKYLPYGIAIILTFIGIKMVIAPFYEIESFHSLMVVGGVLVGSVALSLAFPDKESAEA
jgi:tellurite resistance protein TerC